MDTQYPEGAVEVDRFQLPTPYFRVLHSQHVLVILENCD
jgi:hypothetical protein